VRTGVSLICAVFAGLTAFKVAEMTQRLRDRMIARVLDEYPDLSPLASGFMRADEVSEKPE